MSNSNIELVQVTVPNNEGIVETPTIFTFEFSKDLDLSTGNVNVIFIIQEDKVIKNAPRQITKPLNPVDGKLKSATAELIFPESLAGAKLSITYAITSQKVGKNSLQTDIDIKRANNAAEEIERVYWAEQEHALWGATLTEKKEICKNEVGFLHIYTKGMFGHEVWIDIKGENTEQLRIGTKTMQDNVLSIPYTMSDMIAAYKAAVPDFDGGRLSLIGNASVNPDMSLPKSSSDLLLHCEVDEANPSLLASGMDVKVSITTDEEAVAEPTKAQCILQFRPDNSYIGDYGFDWIRMGDTGSPGYHHDHSFDEHMGKHYHTATMKVENDGNNCGDAFKKDKEPNTNVLDYDTGVIDNTFGEGKMYNRLELRYRRLIFNWDAKDAARSSSETYTPIMTIMNGKTANLDLHLDIKEEPKEILFEFDHSSGNSFLTLDKVKLTTKLSKTKVNKTNKKDHKLKIECKGEFDREYTLFARAFKKDDPKTGPDLKGEICGMLRILPNAPMYQHKIKIALFGVITNINGGVDNKGDASNGKDRIKQILGQALISADEIIEIDLDTTNNPDFITDYCIDDGDGTFIIDGDPVKSWNLRTYLLDVIDSKYEHYYKIFYFDEQEESSNGYSWGEKYVLCFNTANNETAVHELLHSLKLAHPFDAYSLNTPFSYEFIKTDNIMDYGHWVSGLVRKSLFHWHWQIMNSKIR